MIRWAIIQLPSGYFYVQRLDIDDELVVHHFPDPTMDAWGPALALVRSGMEISLHQGTIHEIMDGDDAGDLDVQRACARLNAVVGVMKS